MDINFKLIFPKRNKKGGRLPVEQEKLIDREMQKVVRLMEDIYRKNGKGYQKRSWCYKLESHGLHKDHFDGMSKLIDKYRRLAPEKGGLPYGIIEEERERSFSGGEGWVDRTTPEEEAVDVVKGMKRSANRYNPISIWTYQRYFIQVVVEKVDLFNMFVDICIKYGIPITNGKGWSSINQRQAMIKRWKSHEEQGRGSVLLTATDHDPGGLVIADFMRANIRDVEESMEWDSSNLIVNRFALDEWFIDKHNLSKANNLITAKKTLPNDLADPKHPDHTQPYVQNYLHKFCNIDWDRPFETVKRNGKVIENEVLGRKGWPHWEAWKVEANTMTDYERESRGLFVKALRQYYSPLGLQMYLQKVKPDRELVWKHAIEILESGEWKDEGFFD